MYKASNVRHVEMHTTQPLARYTNLFVSQTAASNLSNHGSPGNDQMLAHLIHAVDEILRSETHLLILFAIRKSRNI
jgi:hypothetical protein